MKNFFDLKKFRDLRARRETKSERLAREEKEGALTEDQRKEAQNVELRKFREERDSL
jgi:hypothetical protein